MSDVSEFTRAVCIIIKFVIACMYECEHANYLFVNKTNVGKMKLDVVVFVFF